MNKKNRQLKEALTKKEIIVYRQDGNRSIAGETMLEKAQSYGVKIGVSSLNKISSLINIQLPIYSSCRPNNKNHYLFGGFSSSLGKGSTDLQSKISCLMEAIEYDCMETIPQNLVRSSFSFLSKTHSVANPELFFRLIKERFPKSDEPIMWTHAYNPRLDCELFVPAELVYFPFESEHYDTQEYFISSSNGLASGASCLEATIHGLYEVLERAILGHKEIKMGYQTPIDADELFSDNPHYQKIKDLFHVDFFLVESFLLPSLPVVECRISDQEKTVMGHGCAFSFMIAMERAFAEALQCLSVYSAGNREDLMMATNNHRQIFYPYSEKKIIFRSEDFLSKEIITLPEKLAMSTLIHKFNSLKDSFSSLNEEYTQLCRYLKEAGHEDFYIVNLSPSHADLAVIKIISPSLMSKPNFYGQSEYSDGPRISRMATFQYRNIMTKK